MNKDKLIIVGTGENGENLYDYITNDSRYQLVAFSAEREFIKKKELLGFPVVPFESLEEYYDPGQYKVIVAISHVRLNRTRTRIYRECKRKGFAVGSYVNPTSIIFKKVEVGENCIIFEGVIIQRNVKLGNNLIIWPGCDIGQGSRIGDNCYISPHVALHGDIGENCFLGTNCCIVNNIKIAKDCIIGAGSVVLRDTEPGKIYVGNPARPLTKTSYEHYRIASDET
jgi:sugar O-acyltransferase (sialic acid O-acetyltransferase NeuD family)